MSASRTGMRFAPILFSVALNAAPARSAVRFSQPPATNAITFSQPISFAEALQSREVRSLLPTTLSSADLRDALEQAFIDRAVFSARMNNAEFLQEIDDVTRDFVEGKINLATARLRLLQKLREIGYQPTPGEEGTLKDFTSDERIDLIIRTNAQIAQGYGQWLQGMRPGVLDAFPCAELFRAAHRRVERGSAESKSTGWETRWREAGGTIYAGRMIARKDDKVWDRLGTMWDDSLGNPYPPFAFNSGMWVKDVRRSVAVSLGVISQTETVAPQDKGFNDDLRFAPKVRNAALLQALMESLGPDYQIKDGVLTRT